MPGTNTGALARDNLSERGEIAAQGVRILVIDFVDVLLAKEARLVHHFLFGAVIVHHRVGRVGSRSTEDTRGE